LVWVSSVLSVSDLEVDLTTVYTCSRELKFPSASDIKIDLSY